MKKILSFDKPTYYINEEKRTVAVKLKVDITTKDLHILKLILKELKTRNIKFNIFYNTFEITSSAKCSPTDKFDVKVGKSLAVKRAKKIAYKIVKNALFKELSRLYPIYDTFYNYVVNKELEIKRFHDETFS